MKVILTLLLFSLCNLKAKADTLDHWIILVNGQRVFECPATCGANGLNLNLLKANTQLKVGDKITVVYIKNTIEPKVTKYITVTDSAVKKSQTFPVYDEAGSRAVIVNTDDFSSFRNIVIWYSEKKTINNKVITTQRIPLVYFD